MLQSLTTKLTFPAVIFAAVVFFAPAQVSGASLSFGEQEWEVEISPEESSDGNVSGYMVRNDFRLKDLALQVFTTEPYKTTGRQISDQTSDTLLEISSEINQPTQNARLVLDESGEWAKEFEPGQDGQGLDLYKTYKLLVAGQTQITLPVLLSKPNNSLDQTNTLGVNELIATGESDFTGSPYNRRVNIKVGADKFQGLILKPGEEFSFNKFLGDVDAKNGYLPELVIKKTGTVPEFGGGLCQVSSTAFRAAMNAGLPITARRNHSYAVKYYAPQGTDATIYPGVQDFKFMNDLDSHLLIRTRMEGNKLYYDFYGTKDNRQVSFDGPYSYDKQSNGAMKATWTRWVEYDANKGGEKKEQVFNSTYQPPALFQVAAQASTPNPESNPNGAPQPDPTPTPDPNAPPVPTPTPTPEQITAGGTPAI